VVSERRLWNKTTYEVRYYISSLTSDAKVFAQAVRSHWGVKIPALGARCHLAEDASGFVRQCPQNFSLLRHLAVNLLQEKTVKEAAMKRYQAGLDNNYLAKVVAS